MARIEFQKHSPYFVILDNALNPVTTLTGNLDAGIGFDPLRNRLYAATSSPPSVRVYDTTTWSLITTILVDDDVPSGTEFSGDQLIVSDDGRWLVLQTSNGATVVRLTVPTTASLTAAPPNGAVPGQLVTLTATIAGGLTAERAGETVTFRDGTNVLGTAVLNNAGIATFSTNLLAAGTYSLNVAYAGDADYLASTSANVPYTIGAPLGIASLRLEDGGIQRSVLRSIEIAFSGIATISAGAFEVTKLGAGGGSVSLSVSTAIVGSQTIATLTFSSFTDPGSSASLSDGDYSLRIRGDLISDSAGRSLDGDGDGSLGGDRVQAFHRLFGDATGDRRVDIADFGLFSLGYLTPANYNAAFDFNNDGRLDIADFGQFSLRYFTNLP